LQGICRRRDCRGYADGGIIKEYVIVPQTARQKIDKSISKGDIRYAFFIYGVGGSETLNPNGTEKP
jgi:hypothetical protein